MFTPSTKAEEGHDENISLDEAADLVGADRRPERVRDRRDRASTARRPRSPSRPGVILADTKFEFGIDPATGELLLIDEVLTPDSSRFWDAADYEPGRAQASYDKQYVRDWLETQPWDKTPPGPSCRRTSWTGRARATSRRSSGSPGRASSATSRTT